jgi:hypothetical protein
MAPSTETRTFTDLYSATHDAVVEDGNGSENVLRSTILLDRMWKNGNVKIKDGGTRIAGRAKYGLNPNAQWFRGAEKLNMDSYQKATRYAYDWCNLHAPIVAVGDDVRMNGGSYGDVDLVAETVSNTLETMAKIVDIEMAGDGSGAPGKSILGLQAFVPTVPTSDPAQGAVGDIAVSGNLWWQNYAVTSFGSMAANGPGGSSTDAWISAYNSISDGDFSKPDLIISAQDVIEFYSRLNLLAAQLAMTDTASKDANRTFRSFSYANADWTWSRNIVSGRAYMLNSMNFEFWVHPKANMSVSEFQGAYDADVMGAHALLTCAFIVKSRLFNAVLDGITA